MSVKTLLALARLATFRLHKSAAPQPNVGVRKRVMGGDPNLMQPMPNPAPLRPGDYARVQRPAHHAQPTLTRIVSSGAHGVVALDDNGQQVRVRHEHVLEAHAQPTPQERAEFARAVAAQGVPISTEDRYVTTDAHGRSRRRPTASQLMLLESMAEHGTPIDIESVRESATYEEVQELLRRFVIDPSNRLTT
jgi:hypothetical protein